MCFKVESGVAFSHTVKGGVTISARGQTSCFYSTSLDIHDLPLNTVNNDKNLLSNN